MKTTLVDALVCPVCREPLTYEGTTSKRRLSNGILRCMNNHTYQVNDEIPILKDPKASSDEFVWKIEFPDLKKYEQIRKEYASYLPEKLRRADESLTNEIAKVVSKHALVLDIASGMGHLLSRLSQLTSEKTSFLGTDVDEKPLRGAKLKLEHMKTYNRVSLCVMDAKHLAIADRIIPCITSFFGFNNIPEPQKTFLEAQRVLTPKGQLVIASLWLEKGSKSLDQAAKLGFGATATEDGLSQVLETSGFKIDTIRTYHSGEWQRNPMDLLPFEGDWFAHVLTLAHKT